jgi:hypothetical protein
MPVVIYAMNPKSRIHIVSGKLPEFNSNVTHEDVTYHVQTEDMGAKACKVVSNVYQEGAVVFSKETDYSEMTEQEDFGEKLKALMDGQHRSVFDEFLSAQKHKYIDEAKKLLRRGGGLSALNTLKDALKRFPEDPLLLSFYGFLVASVEKNPKGGIDTCEGAVKSAKGSSKGGRVIAECYLNLGKARLRHNNRSGAMDAFREGLKAEPGHRDLMWELKKMGTRRRPPIPFISRNNPINKYLGLFLKKLRGA